ncbi:ATPase family AAA domain-containing protein FIGL1 [Trifolium repens]|nr:ATPase family AAA domain-containing protein FIGL1 [Trifolium repens]
MVPTSKSFFNLINNNSEDCIIIGRPQSHGIQTKGPGVSFVFKVEGERRACGNTSPTKHAHMENTTPRVYVKSPSCKEYKSELQKEEKDYLMILLEKQSTRSKFLQAVFLMLHLWL